MMSEMLNNAKSVKSGVSQSRYKLIFVLVAGPA